MLETEEVDVDYFTPASSTSLSKIFSNTIQTEDGPENSSLKYVPPLPTQVNPKPEEEKPTQCVLYAMTVNAYEWHKNSYVSKERIGFTIIKIIKSAHFIHNIILYDSNKTILSCLTLTTSTEINIKENISMSFYDNKQKYWSIYTNSNEINKILDILKGLNVCLRYPTDAVNDLSKKDDTDNTNRHSMAPIVTNEIKNDEKESDTDSSINRRTKDSILKRMATMGQSVLPPTHRITAQTSDSSDTNEIPSQQKSRHKPLKNPNKRNIEKNILENVNNNDSQLKKIMATPSVSSEANTFQNTDQIVGVKIMDIAKSPGNILSDENEMTLFITEQRLSNSELRINMSRITDKLDHMLNKVNCLENVERNDIGNNMSHIQNEITYKLLNEYEKKIKTYEDFIKSKGFNCDTFELISQSSKTDIKCDCKQLCEEKDRQIMKLKEDVQLISSKLEENKQKNEDNILTKQINNMTLQKDGNEVAQNNEEVTIKLKSIMNETFQTISTNFDNETKYTGAIVKTTVASVIKKTTMDYLKEH